MRDLFTHMHQSSFLCLPVFHFLLNSIKNANFSNNLVQKFHVTWIFCSVDSSMKPLIELALFIIVTGTIAIIFNWIVLWILLTNHDVLVIYYAQIIFHYDPQPNSRLMNTDSDNETKLILLKVASPDKEICGRFELRFCTSLKKILLLCIPKSYCQWLSLLKSHIKFNLIDGRH